MTLLNIENMRTKIHEKLNGRTVVVSTCGSITLEDAIANEPTSIIWFYFIAEFFSYIKYHSYTVVSPADGTCGKKVNNTWSGVIGMVHRREAEFGVDMTATLARMEDVDFSKPVITSSLVIVTAAPSALPNDNYFLDVFTSEAYFLILVIPFIISLLSIMFEILFKKYSNQGVGFFNFIGAIAWRGTRLLCAPAHAGLRSKVKGAGILFVTWFFALQIFCSTYNNFIYVEFAIPTKSAPINTPEELYREVSAGKMWWGTIGSSAYDNMFQIAPEGTMHKLWNSASAPQAKHWMTKGREDGYERVRFDSKYAFVDASFSSHAVKENYTGVFYISTSAFNLLLESVAFTRNSPIKGIINIYIQYITESGVLDKWYHDVARAARKKYVEDEMELSDSNEKPLQLKVTKYIFFGLIVAHSFSGLVCVVEVLSGLGRKKFAKKTKEKEQVPIFTIRISHNSQTHSVVIRRKLLIGKGFTF